MNKGKWVYKGPESSPAPERTVKGKWGRVTVEKTSGTSARVIDIDGFRLEVPLGLAEEIMMAITGSLRPYAGFSIFQHIQQQLDDVVDSLMEAIKEYGEDDEVHVPDLKLECAVFAECLAMVRDTRNPDIEYEKARAMERWEARNS